TLPLLHVHMAQIAAQIERPGKLRGWRAMQTEAMPSKAAFETKLDMIEDEWRCRALIVVPHDLGVANQDLRLMQHPVCQSHVIRRLPWIDLHSGNVQHALLIAAQCEMRADDCELFEPELEKRQRSPGHDQIDFRKLQQCGRRSGDLIDGRGSDP